MVKKSDYYDSNNNLDAVAVFCYVLLLGILFYRMAQIVCWMALSLFFVSTAPKNSYFKLLERYGHAQLFGSGIDFLLHTGVSLLRLIAMFFRALMWTIYSLLPLLALALLLVLLQERWAEFMLMLASENETLRVMRWFILAPFIALAEIGAYALPIFNLAVLVLIHLPLQLLLRFFMVGGDHGYIFLFFREIGAAGPPLAVAAAQFVTANSVDCNRLFNNNYNISFDDTTTATISPIESIAQDCFLSNSRTMDFMPSFQHLQQASIYGVLSIGSGCNALETFSNITFFPATDSSLWKALNSALNALLSAVVVAPAITIQRCKLAGGFALRPAMCTPDMGPSFDWLAAASFHLGDVLNHWLDAIYRYLFFKSTAAAPLLSEKQDTSSLLFGKNATVLVRMQSDLFAITDGYLIKFVLSNHNNNVYVVAPLWRANVAFGVARANQNQDVALFGCSCTDDSMMRLTCATVTQSENVQKIKVEWSLAAETQLLVCDRVRIVVQSIRWSQTRGTMMTASTGNLAADIAVYVIPICGAQNAGAMACLPSPSFTRGICFPYCLGLRMQHEKQGSTLTLRGAYEWTNGVVVAMRNCASASSSGSSITDCNTGASSSLPNEALASPSTCTYAWACTSVFYNKSEVPGYSPMINSVQDKSARLILDGQPLAVAGGVHMREYKPYFFDFPTLVGNKYNEFTMESSSYLSGYYYYDEANQNDQNTYEDHHGYKVQTGGIMDAPPMYIPNTNSLNRDEQGGTRKIMMSSYNPATLSPDAFWYATNPSYDWISAFSEFCDHNVALTQLMLTSTYHPPRIQRVSNTKNRMIVSIALPLALSLASLFSSSEELYNICIKEIQFDLFVESMEYFDASNIAVAVRRDTIAMQGGSTIFYFVNVSDVRQIREGIPWPITTALHYLPIDIGTFLGHSLSAVVRLFQTPVNFAMNPFSIHELIRARGDACPENSLLHSAATNCGMQLLSLNAFFDSVYMANTAFWNIIVWLISIFFTNAADDNNDMMRDLMNGAAVVGDASRIVTLFDKIERSVEIFDTGAQHLILEGGRRLLVVSSNHDDDHHHETKGNLSDHSRKLLLVKAVAKGAMSSVTTQIKWGTKGVFALTKFVAQMSVFAGADIGVLLSSQDPRTQLAAVTAPSIAWAQFTYEVSVPIILDIMYVYSKIYDDNAENSIQKLLGPFWLNIHDAVDRFDIVIDSRMQRACLGIRLMLGYSNNLAQGLYHNCMAGVAFPRAILSLVALFSIDISLYRCLCVHAAGQDYVPYVIEKCSYLISPSRRALWQQAIILNAVPENICNAYLHDLIETQAVTAFDDWAMHAEDSARYLGSFLNEIFTQEKDCAADTGAIVLTPLPLSHYHVCAKTTLCEARCRDTFSLFQNELAKVEMPHQTSQKFELPFESPFFNSYNTNNNGAKWKIVAMVSLPVANATSECRQHCGKAEDYTNDTSRCAAVLFSSASSTFQLRLYCIPDSKMLMATVFQIQSVDDILISSLDEKNVVLRHTEILWPAQKAYTILFYMTRSTFKKDLDEVQTDEVYAWWSPVSKRFLIRSNDLESILLTPQIQRALFANTVLQRPQVSGCRITAIFALNPQLFFFAITIQIKGYTMAGNDFPQKGGHTLHVIHKNNYMDDGIMEDPTQKKKIQFFVPCSSLLLLQSDCNPDLDTLITLANYGTFFSDPLLTSSDLLYLPSSPILSTTFPASFLTTASPQRAAFLRFVGEKFETVSTFSIASSEYAWTRANIFSDAAMYLQKPIYDSAYHHHPDTPTSNSVFLFQALPQQPDAWLQELRPVKSNGIQGYRFAAYKSQQTTAKVTVDQICSISVSCSGCSTYRLRLLCAAAQDCALTRCVGTVVQTHNVLCGLGSVMEQTSIHAIATWRAIYATCVELALLVMRGLMSDEIVTRITLRFPTDQFYALVCTCKDTYAKFVGLGMGLGKLFVQQQKYVSITSFFTNQENNGSPLQTGQDTLKSASIAGLVFNMIAGSTLLPTMALHRWIICTANVTSSEQEGVVIEFGDVTMDKSWLPCASIGGISELLNGNNIQTDSTNVLEQFISFALSLLSGIGETILYGMQLSFDSSIDYIVGLIWNLQDILYAFNLRSCKNSDYAMHYVMQCACGDIPHIIPQPQRSQTEGALWCVGTLSGILTSSAANNDATIIYNPYSLDTLSEGVRGVNTYIQCLSQSKQGCTPPKNYDLLPVLQAQGADPISVWARCKSNYAMGIWDPAAGALFSDASTSVTPSKRAQAMLWAQTISPQFLDCLVNEAPSICLTLYHSLMYSATPAAYFVYTAEKEAKEEEPPDACLVFSGLKNASVDGTPLHTLMNACSDESSSSLLCDLSPIGTSFSNNKIAAAYVHGTTSSSKKQISYASAISKLEAAYTVYSNHNFDIADNSIKLFSADGDFIHDFFDCMFMGPYNAVEILPCDAEGVLDCPFYARDPEKKTRDFTASCLSSSDSLPFTCGSNARQSIIKYFFRTYSHMAVGQNLSRSIQTKVGEIFANYTNPGSMGCYNPTTGMCAHSDTCSFNGGYSPCMDTTFELNSQEVGLFIINQILESLPAYYAFVLTSTAPWLVQTTPFQWKKDPLKAAAAQRLSHFAPKSPIVSYNNEEVYEMNAEDDTTTSIWSMCTALLGHAAMSLPIVDPILEKPFFGEEGSTSVEDLVRKITQTAMQSASPFFWHADRRHAPSPSSACTQNKKRQRSPPGKLVIETVAVQTPSSSLNVKAAEGLSFPLYGYMQARIGSSSCVCAISDADVLDRCQISDETCSTWVSQTLSQTNNNDTVFLALCDILNQACTSTTRFYNIHDNEAVMQCLMHYGEKVRCPELGPSDIWGFFPVGCTTKECPDASNWISSGSHSKVSFDGGRFVTDGRAGLRLPNYKHVNDTFHDAIHYYDASTKNKTTKLPFCFDPKTDLMPTSADEDVVNDYADEEYILSTLFPAAQLRFDAPVTSICSRYIIEVARAEIYLKHNNNNSAAAELQRNEWRRRCEAKIRQLASCASMGVFYDLPHHDTDDLAIKNQCGDPDEPSSYFAAGGGCVLVDQKKRRMYDGPLCKMLREKDKNYKNDAACELKPQPLDLLVGDISYSMVYSENAKRLSDDWLSNLSPDILTLQNLNDYAPQQQTISHVLDWWSDDATSNNKNIPLGFHPTAPSDPTELAPMVFDSHMLYDPETTTVHYTHNSARDADLLYDTLGAAGVCRSPNMNMPMFTANTNRICTSASTSVNDMPHMPSPNNNDFFYNAEKCAKSHRDTPWMATIETDPQSLSVGGIPKWQKIAEVLQDGTTYYPYDSFPSQATAVLTPLHYDDGDSPTIGCNSVWGSHTNCSVPADCPIEGTICILPQGVCHSYRVPDRTPCFQSNHCPNGMICAADGSCAPLRLHVWNPTPDPLEFTVMADKCGFQESLHPYTQSSRGASPWERVPDLLHVHGMCSHGNWFAYRNVLRSKMCSQTTSDTLECNSSQTYWPWVHERFDGQQSTAETRQTMDRTLFVEPHACDESYMHLRAPSTGQRFQVCSGTQGQPDANDHDAYELFLSGQGNHNNNNTETTTTAAHWMRTYSEKEGSMIHVGVLPTGDEAALGFLGADSSIDSVLGSMAFGHTRFFRCSDRMACQNPPFTYNGLVVERHHGSENSLRRCGSIGYLWDEAEEGVCWLDIALFPIFSTLLAISSIPNQEDDSINCQKIWVPPLLNVIRVQKFDSALLIRSSPRSFFCSERGLVASSWMYQCAFAARASTRLVAASAMDSVMFLTESLNTLVRSVGTNIKTLYERNHDATRVYETINQCMAEVIKMQSSSTSTIVTTSQQTSAQFLYNSAIPNGIYFALRITLYEMPLAWFHHTMLVTLLSLIDSSVATPQWNNMGNGPVPVDLWTDEDRAVRCASESLDIRPLLWRIICHNAHPSYTFLPSSSVPMTEMIHNSVVNDITNQMPSSSWSEVDGPVSIFCYTAAAWACQQGQMDCTDALKLAYNTTQCPLQYSEYKYLDPCSNPQLFDLQDRVKISVDELQKNGGSIAVYLDQLLKRYIDLAQKVAAPVDYVTTIFDTLDTKDDNTAALVRIWPFFYTGGGDDYLASFNLTDWLYRDVCQMGDEVCSVQTKENDPCLYPWTLPPDEIKRYYHSEEEPQPAEDPSIRIFYSTFGSEPTVFSVCDLFEQNHDDEVCLLQYGGNTDFLKVDSTNFVSCDIESIQVPPGVEVQAFAVQKSLAQWTDTLVLGCNNNNNHAEEGCPHTACVPSPPDVVSCTWQTNGQGPAWWSGASNNIMDDATTNNNMLPVNDDSAGSFDPMNQNFDGMENWWPLSSTKWKNEGCGLHGGVCALRVRLERSSKAHGMCYPTAAAAVEGCGETPFLTKKGPISSLYRCASCTRRSPYIIAPPSSQTKRTLIGCYIGDSDTENQISQPDAESAFASSVAYLQDPNYYYNHFGDYHEMLTTHTQTFDNGTALDLKVPLEINPALTLHFWKQRVTDAPKSSACDVSNPTACGWSEYDIGFILENDDLAWKRAVENPSIEFTLICAAQSYTQQNAQECNPRTDVRRQLLATFVESQYRQKNGLWMQVAAPNTGVSWRANVAHSDVNMFSIAYASGKRAESERRTSWILGQGPCNALPRYLPDRICVESTDKSLDAFEPMHPWLGGVFNAFEGVDECPGTTGALCSCACAPQFACYNMSQEQKNEFPELPGCIQQAYPQIRTMREDDASNLCSAVKQKQSATICTHFQGLLGGGKPARSVSSDEFHGENGIPTIETDFSVQELLRGGTLWSGATVPGKDQYGFLRMRRTDMHPAHIAFSIDSSLTGSPMVIKAVSLLFNNNELPMRQTDLDSSLSWINTLSDNLKTDANTAAKLYPQLLHQKLKNEDWSCPLRTMAFWGGEKKNGGGGPLSPHPPLMAVLYPDLNGAHPFISARTLNNEEDLLPYGTTNGACFYPMQTNNNDGAYDAVDNTDTQNPCGLRGMLSNLVNAQASISMVIEKERCNQILDNGKALLRSGELLESINPNKKCGVLHRLSPFQMRIKGDGGKITPLADGRTTRDKGGDCHMGRALIWPVANRDEVAGTQCALISQNKTHAISHCPFTDNRIVFRRSKPLSLQELLSKKERRYRSQGLPEINFLGPGGVVLDEPEISFGFLYVTPLRRKLAHDMVLSNMPPGPGLGFIERYASTNIKLNTKGSLRLAQQRDDLLWNASNWTWSYFLGNQNNQTNNVSEPKARGSVNKEHWLRDRFGACNASYSNTFLSTHNLPKNIKAIPLCEPAPTPALQILCKAMLQYRTDIAHINCQMAGDCLYRPGAFYTPYAWSSTNQQYAADTLITFYKGILNQARFKQTESYEALCPERNAFLAQIAALSHIQTHQCPANQIEYLKDILKSIKHIGKELLELGFCFIMFCVNSLGALFSVSSDAMAAMMQLATSYLKRFIDILGQIAMPILNAMVSIIFGTSSLGQIIREALRILCEIYNNTIRDLVVPIWCNILLPALYFVLRSLSGIVGPFDSNAAGKIDEVWNAISGGGGGVTAADIRRCISTLAPHIVCNTANEDDFNSNGSAFLPQALATRCWTSSSAGGISADNYLSCTSSDTCALDVLNFDLYDSKAALVSCASCPSFSVAAFGCNTYLKRCTCGGGMAPPSQCSSAADCSISDRVCAVSSRLDNVANAFAKMPCSECGPSLLPSCVEGTCACTQPDGLAQTCDIGMRGRRVSMLESSGFCLATNIPYFSISVDLVLDFSTLSLVSCLKDGLSRNNACLGVIYPTSQNARSLVVIFMVNPVPFSSRRLLGDTPHHKTPDENNTDHDPDEGQAKSNQIQIIIEACESEYANNHANGNRHYDKMDQNHELLTSSLSRQRIKWCIHWRITAAQADIHPNDALLSFFGTGRAILNLILSSSEKNDKNRYSLQSIFKEYDSGIIPSMLASFFSGVAPPSYPKNESQSKTYANFSSNSSYYHHHPHPNKSSMGMNGSHHARKLFQVLAESVDLNQWSCTALEIPLLGIASAFWDTVAYYTNNNHQSNNETLTESANYYYANTNNNNLSDGNPQMKNASSSFFSNVPFTEAIENGGLAAAFADAVTAGQGRRLVAAFVSSAQENGKV